VAKYEEKKVAKIAVKKIYKAYLCQSINGTSIITRPNLPMIIDTTKKAVEWLKANSFQSEDIEIIGDKPECWNEVFPEPTPSLAVAIENVLAN
jgi:hypothetical protein